MPILADFNSFEGRHYETGTVRNALAYQGFKAPHTGEAPSEALLLGISGGIAVGYFTFEYKGYLPHVVILTRNTFDPFETLLTRLGIPRDVLQSENAAKGEKNLLNTLESGRPALVWADMFSLPYNNYPYDQHNWMTIPVLAYGLDNGTAYLADRSGAPQKIPAETLLAARSRVKQLRNRVMVLDEPDWTRLPDAVEAGIRQCCELFLDSPPKRRRENFGVAALQHWPDVLTNVKSKDSWARYFPAGERLWMAIAGTPYQPGAFGWIHYGEGDAAERGKYAAFLTEAATILQKPGLSRAADLFRASEHAWAAFGEALLPDNVPLMAETKSLLRQRRTTFTTHGSAGLPEIQEIDAHLKVISKEVAESFPLSEPEVAVYRETLAEHVRNIESIEREAAQTMREVME